MKLIALSFLVSLLAATTSANENLIPSSLKDISSARNAILEIYKSFQNATCAISCLHPSRNVSAQVIDPIDNQTTVSPLDSIDINAVIDTMCDGLENLRQCWEGCQDEESQKVIAVLSIGVSEPYQFMCVDYKQELKEHLPCLTIASHQASNKCLPQCEALKPSSFNLTVDQANSTFGQAIEEILSNTCEYTGCLDKCVKPDLEKDCGLGAVILNEKFLKHSMKTMKAVLVTLNMALPDSCQKLGQTTSSASMVQAWMSLLIGLMMTFIMKTL